LGGSGNEPHSDANGNMTEDQVGNDLAYDA
jgi:hypothetical protein